MEKKETAKIIYHDRVYTYKDISQNVKKFSSHIRLYSGNKRILIYLNHDPNIIFAIMAVLKLGLTYIPVSINTPQKRLDYIIEDSAPELIITAKSYTKYFEKNKVLCIEDMMNDGDKNKSIGITPKVNTPAYIIYTSGSTGVPKGVEISYGALRNFDKSMSLYMNFKTDDRIACLTDFAFDISFLESIYAVNNGLSVYVADEMEQVNPRMTKKFIINNNISVLQMVPTRLLLLKKIDPFFTSLKSVRILMVGGEVFPTNMLYDLQKYTEAKIYNMYGPTETTIWSTIADLTESDFVNIGFPILNTEVHVIDDKLNPVANGEVGEIVIGGMGLANKYLNNNGLTDTKFIYLFGNKRYYKTGDLGRFINDGSLVYMGRMDNQIKLNGYRIELEEIEKVINEFYGVHQSIVCFDGKALIAVLNIDMKFMLPKLKEYLKNLLPTYMIPAFYYELNEFVYTTSGKVDRKMTLERALVKGQLGI